MKEIESEKIVTTFIVTIDALQNALNEGNIDVYKFYEEIVMLNDYIKNNGYDNNRQNFLGTKCK